jgi:hypothetical protein
MVFIDIILTIAKKGKKRKKEESFLAFFLNKMNENCN